MSIFNNFLYNISDKESATQKYAKILTRYYKVFMKAADLSNKEQLRTYWNYEFKFGDMCQALSLVYKKRNSSYF